MSNLRVSVAQFEPKDGEKNVNLSIMEDLIIRAKDQGSDVISFHELCTTGYTYLKNLNRDEIESTAEVLPGGQTLTHLTELATRSEERREGKDHQYRTSD